MGPDKMWKDTIGNKTIRELAGVVEISEKEWAEKH